MSNATRDVLLGQIGLFFFLIICIILKPHFLFEHNEGGISNYGLYAKTIVPYTLAFLTSGVFTLLATRSVRNRRIRIALWILGILTLLVLISTYPYKSNHTLDSIHEGVSTALFVIELTIGSWFSVFLARNKVSLIALIVQYTGFTIGILNYADIIHKLFIAEVVASLGFSAILVKTIDRISEKSSQ